MKRSAEIEIVERRIAEAKIDFSQCLASDADQGAAEKAFGAVHFWTNVSAELKEKRFSTHWLALLIAAASLFIVCIGALTHLVSPLITLDAQVTDFRIEMSKSQQLSPGLPVITGSVLIDGSPLIKAEDLEAKSASLNQIEIAAPASISFHALENHCYQLKLESGSLSATLGLWTGGAIKTQPVSVSPGSALQFCSLKLGAIALEQVKTLTVATEVSAVPPPPQYASSVISGKLGFAATAGEHTLEQTEWLFLGGIDHGRLTILPSEKFRVIFSGNVDRPILNAQPSVIMDGGADLRPSLMDFFLHNPVWASLLGALSGVSGVLWAVLKMVKP